jgi:transcriptional regulator with XRE-family HTH domain
MNIDNLDKRMLSIRKQKNLNQKPFSDLLNMTSCYISQVELGKRNPSINFIMSVLKVTQVSADWLLLGKGSMYPPIKKEKQEIKEINEDRAAYGADNSPGFDDVLDALQSHWGELRNDQKKVLMVMLKEMIENNKMRKENYKIREFIIKNAATQSGDSLQIPS